MSVALLYSTARRVVGIPFERGSQHAALAGSCTREAAPIAPWMMSPKQPPAQGRSGARVRIALERVAQELHATKRTLILCGAREQPAKLIHQAEFEQVVGHENICANVQEALQRAEAVFEKIEAKAKAVAQ